MFVDHPFASRACRWTDRQVPVTDEVFLDHTAHFVRDLDGVAPALARLGFRPSAVSLQTNLGEDGVARPSGTSNRLVRLRRGFLEFLAATHDTPLAAQLRAATSRYEGLHLIAFSRADLERQRARLLSSGFDMQPMVHMRRRAVEPGIDGEVAWSVLRPAPGVMPEGRIQFVYPHTPELSWPPGSMEHPNRAEALTGVLLVVADVDETVRRYRTYLDRDPAALERGVVRIVDANEAARTVPGIAVPGLPYIAAVSVAVTDLDRTKEVLEENRIATDRPAEGALWVRPADALGSHLCFHRLQRAAP